MIFVLALIGFGAKAGLVPFHVWLPEAHPAAPSHVSALMSGVMIKMGLYGILRVVSFIGPPAPWWGVSLGALGLLTALVGDLAGAVPARYEASAGLLQHRKHGSDRLGLGVGLLGSATGQTPVVVLGISAGLLHIWNHALMKCLMFFAAGSVLHGTGTKDLEKLGGIAKRMPWTGVTMIIGAVAVAALPPLNGFVSKWLLYLSLMKCGLTTGGGRLDSLARGRPPRPGWRPGGDCVRASHGNRRSWVRREAMPPATRTNPRPGCSPRCCS